MEYKLDQMDPYAQTIRELHDSGLITQEEVKDYMEPRTRYEEAA